MTDWNKEIADIKAAIDFKFEEITALEQRLEDARARRAAELPLGAESWAKTSNSKVRVEM